MSKDKVPEVTIVNDTDLTYVNTAGLHFKNPTYDETNPNYRSEIERSNIFGYLWFSFLWKTMRTAFRLEKQGKYMDENDLPGLAWKERPEVIEARISRYLEDAKKKNPNKTPNLAWAIIKSTKWGIFLAHALELSFIWLRTFAAYCAYKILNIFMDPTLPFYMAFVWAAILSAVMTIGTIAEHHAFQHKTLVPLQVKGALVSLVYTKMNKLSVYSMNQISLGKLVNIVANDVNVMEKGGLSFTNLITGSLGLVGGTALLWILFNETILVGIGYLIMSYPLQNIITRMSVKHRDELTRITDSRIKATNEVIDGIRLLKMYTWELIFRDNIDEIRKKEISLLWKIKVYDAIIRTISISAQYVASFLFFLAYYLTGGELSPAKIFPAYYLIGFLRIFSTFFIAQGFVFLAEANLLFKRITAILEAPEIGAISFPEPKDTSNTAEFDNFSAYWTKNDEENADIVLQIKGKDASPQLPSKHHHDRPTISNVTLNLKPNSLSALVGKVGSGKSSFLLSFTGEMPKTTGSLRYTGSIAYVEQEPTIFAGTVREGILFGKPFKPDFYAEVIKNCNLESDLKLFANGDMSECGEKGINLSGGQKARLALARAVYADADIYLLDDPLSAVDAKVAKSLYENAIKGMLKNKTVILATHQVHFVKELENIMVIDEGKIVAHGDYQKLKKEYKDVDKVFATDDTEEDKKLAANNTIKGPTEEQIRAAKEKEMKKEAEIKAALDAEKKEPIENTMTEEEKKIYFAENPTTSYITGQTYLRYFEQMGGFFAILAMVCSLIITNMTGIGYARILASWSINEFPRKTSLAVEGSLVGFAVVALFLEYLLWYSLMLKASRRYHSKMLDRLIRNPAQFFDSNPLGRILNRFSNDMGVIDTFLPSSGLDVVDFIATMVALFLTLFIVQPICIGPAAGAIICIIGLVYWLYPSIKQSRNYELMSRSPLYSQFSSTLSGIVIIRSYKQVNTITNKFRTYLNNNVKGSISYSATSRALGFYVDVTYGIAAIGNIFIMTAKGKDSPGIAAFGLIIILSINGIIQYTLRQIVQTHLLMASASRVQAYCDIPSEAELVVPKDQEVQKKDWPQAGKIDFSDVFMKYRPDHPYVIKGLDVHALPGEKIGCIGRTGAGKSSIIQTLFRMVEVDRRGSRNEGSSITIDGVDIQTLGLHQLRNNISIIPQTPFIFSGTIRKNLDPLGHHNDETLWKVLEDVNLKSRVENLENGIDTDMTNASSIFSVGQKQLICLARTILKKSKILVLDEATANVDKQTDDFIQAKVMEKFGDCTIFTIAHRLSTIANYDKVLVMDKGRKVEFDEPYLLLVNNIGDDTITNTEGDFASMVLNTGARTSREILHVAKETYERKHGVIQKA